MIYPSHRNPATGSVTVFTSVGCLNMIGRFTGGRRAIMTVGATASHIAVIEYRTGPAIGGMTIITVIAALDMVRWLAARRHPVTDVATSQDLIMIRFATDCPATRAMTSFTNIGRLRMITTFTWSSRAIMTTGTIVGDIAVIKYRT